MDRVRAAFGNLLSCFASSRKGVSTKGFDQAQGYYVVSYFRWLKAGAPLNPYEERSRVFYRWHWRARLAASPRIFFARVGPGEYGAILTRVIPASDSGSHAQREDPQGAEAEGWQSGGDSRIAQSLPKGPS